eukprot:TRINITY_DN6076_c0_g1_i1.p1 TRINITY_DN6076_c0_g1~~TRINITY_DN6076_c0_g1_i1.p1  ORF type:complete len:710 (+),score=274.23 TRINITY_DN6076_c0_g1_i1:90-2219(+)
MPLTPDHDWTETDAVVTVRVHLRRVKKEAIDVTVSDCYLKVSCPPHVWEADLKYGVDDLKARHVVEADCTVRVTLPKATAGLVWGELKAEGDKAELRQRRADSLLRAEQSYTERLRTRKDQKGQEEKRFFHEHWDLEKQQRKDIEQRMADEKKEVGDDLAQWEDSVADPAQPRPVAAAPEPGSAAEQRQILEDAVAKRAKAPNMGWAPTGESALKQRQREQQKAEGSTSPPAPAAEEPAAAAAEKPTAEKPAPAAQKPSAETHSYTEKRPVPALLDESLSADERRERWRTASERYQAAQKGEISAGDRGKIFGASDVLPAPRDTATVSIDFTPTNLVTMPQRQRDDDEVYRRSLYKPKSLQDTPLHFKELGDKLYAQKQWKSAADAFSEALKRDTCYMAALCNRSVCWLRLHKYKRAVEDCTLALNMLQSMPAANTTGDRFRAGMMRLYARRGAALCWDGRLREGLKDYEMADGYSVGDLHKGEIAADLQAIRDVMRERGLVEKEELHPLAIRKAAADRLLSGAEGHKYQEAYDAYTAILDEQPDYWDVVANRVCTCLYLRRFKEAAAECDRIIEHCQHVAGALCQGGVGQLGEEGAQDSDDDEDCGGSSDDSADEGQPRTGVKAERRRASKLVKSNTSSVYALLKAYVRKGGALCAMGDMRGAYEHFELALRIVPYDDDLRWDAEQLRQKLQLKNVIAAATGKEKEIQ